MVESTRSLPVNGIKLREFPLKALKGRQSVAQGNALGKGEIDDQP